MEELWQSKLPLKLKIFMWLVHRNRLQTADNLGGENNENTTNSVSFADLKRVLIT
jgi:hypothetical protein